MARSPVASRFQNNIYWDSKPRSTGPGADASSSQGQSAVARYKLSLFKGGGRFTRSDDIVKGRELGKKVAPYIESIDIEEDEDMTTKLTLSLANPEAAISKNRVIEEGDAALIDIGYGQQFFSLNQRYVFIRSHPGYTRDGISAIKYIGYDGRFAMISADFLANKRSRALAGGALIRGRRQGVGQGPSVFKKQRDDQIIDRIAYHYGFSIDVDRIPGARTRVRKKKTSHWEFIRKIAKKRNYTAWVDWDDTNQTYCIHYRPKETRYTKGYVFHHGTPSPKDIKQIELLPNANNSPIGTLLEFHPTLDTTRMITDIEVMHFDRRKRLLDAEWISYVDKTIPPPPPDPDEFDFTRNLQYGAQLKFKVGGRVISTLANKPFKNKKQAKEYAFNLVNQHQADFMTARGTVIGTQDLRPRQIHRLTGIDRYSGDYYFTQVTHHYRNDGFYETEFVAYRLLDQSLPGLLRRGQITQRSQGPLITSQGVKWPGG